MGNVGSVRLGGEEGKDASYLSHEESEDFMGQSPPQSPGGAGHSPPLIFTPQAPVVPLQKVEDMRYQSDLLMHKIIDEETVQCGQGILTMITWNHGGKEVFVEGSWDNWKTKMILHRSGKEFAIMKVLPSGYYQYRFIVDGEWKYAPEMPLMHDDMGNVYNILDVQEYVPEAVGNIACFEPPHSPEASYCNWPLGSEDYAKEPPTVPPQLQLTLLNTPTTMSSSSSLSRPPHVVLNHLYIQKGKSGHPVVALGATRRFRAKYVTVVLYKSLQR
ncbi:SNF1-related protein kinase regulatory subunit beta-2 [Typha angustifolia]|uniref:SNF1-related protein kinase regulatory subunit beta-2 n=1 Tax=Typha angustifolia TaxID=59011 RepID=UPI003C2AF2C8